jgi:hypothetical protein
MRGAGPERDHEMDQAQAPDYDGSLFLRCPQSLPAAIKQAAGGNMTSASACGASAFFEPAQARRLIPMTRPQ